MIVSTRAKSSAYTACLLADGRTDLEWKLNYLLNIVSRSAVGTEFDGRLADELA
jgi:hypothetical protein